MDIKKIDELLRAKGNCEATTNLLIIEMLAKVTANTTRIVELLESEAKEEKDPNQMELPIDEAKAEIEKKVEEKVVEAIEEEVKKPAPKKKAAPKVVEAEPVVEEEPAPVAEKILPTKDEVMTELIAFIHDNGEEPLAGILKQLGDFKNFPEVPEEKYEELLTLLK